MSSKVKTQNGFVFVPTIWLDKYLEKAGSLSILFKKWKALTDSVLSQHKTGRVSVGVKISKSEVVELKKCWKQLTNLLHSFLNRDFDQLNNFLWDASDTITTESIPFDWIFRRGYFHQMGALQRLYAMMSWMVGTQIFSRVDSLPEKATGIYLNGGMLVLMVYVNSIFTTAGSNVCSHRDTLVQWRESKKSREA